MVAAIKYWATCIVEINICIAMSYNLKYGSSDGGDRIAIGRFFLQVSIFLQNIFTVTAFSNINRYVDVTNNAARASGQSFVGDVTHHIGRRF
jgi:hypothetical protein